MSFVCDNCHEVTKAGEPMVRVVVETRKKEYPARRVTEDVFDPGGCGHETVREEARCPRCAPR